jgi:protein arginine N-methyltransferase 1
MDIARHLAVNTWSRGKVARDNLLTDLQRWGPIDYRVVDGLDARARLSWTVTRPGTGHGFAAGFDRTVSEGVYLSNAPDAPETIRPKHIYGTVFFPWSAPVVLADGDLVTVDLEARLIGGDYIWSWRTQVQNRERGGGAKASFAQSTFLGAPLSSANLKKRGSTYTTALNEDGRIARRILEAMNDALSVGEIARLVSLEFPARFRRPQDALSHVADLSQRYG